MNLELLIKLAKLANNNPNDNEANLAARKVCKMIAEAKYNFNNSAPSKEPSIRPREPEVRTWNDVKRSTEPFWKSSPPPYTNSANNPSDRVKDWFYNQYTQQQKDYHNQYSKRPDWTGSPYGTQEPIKKEVHIDWNEPFSGRDRPDMKIRNCSKCKQDIKTSDLNDPLICGKCQWIEYENQRNSRT